MMILLLLVHHHMSYVKSNGHNDAIISDVRVCTLAFLFNPYNNAQFLCIHKTTFCNQDILNRYDVSRTIKYNILFDLVSPFQMATLG